VNDSYRHRPGELFGRIELNSELSDESKAGKLILSKCQSILLRVTSVDTDKRKGRKKMDKKKKSSSTETKVDFSATSVLNL
jgi:hypothetical protein